jgi:hypothetical protein
MSAKNQKQYAALSAVESEFYVEADGMTICYDAEPAQNGGRDDPPWDASVTVTSVDVDALSIDLLVKLEGSDRANTLAWAQKIALADFIAQGVE